MLQPDTDNKTHETTHGLGHRSHAVRDVSPASRLLRLSRELPAVETEHDMLTEVGRALDETLQPTALAYVWQANDNEFSRLHGFLIPVDGLPQEQRDQIAVCCRRACQSDAPFFEPFFGQPAITLYAVPVTIGGRPRDALVFIGRASMNADRERCGMSLLLAAEAITGWHLRRMAEQRGHEAESTAALVELLAKVQAATNPNSACRMLVETMQRYVGCTQVAVGLCEGRRSTLRVVAASGHSELDSKSGHIRAAAVALDECLLREAVTIWPPPDDSHRHAALGLDRFADISNSKQVVTAPLRDDNGHEIGAWLFRWDNATEIEQTLRFLSAAEQPVASLMKSRLHNEPGRIGRTLRDTRHFFSRRRGQITLVATALLLAAMFIPATYEVQCDCELQPVARRFVAAPYEGRLEEAFVEPGDIVSKDQLLARMDDREVRWEQAAALADLQRAGKERDAHMAGHDVALAQISRLEMERLDVKRQQLDRRGRHLEIRSPIDGIVVTGDLKKIEGAPIGVGETLFEVAPLDRMVFEIAIPDEDISHVSVGMPITITLDAYPQQKWSGTLERIHPRSELKDHEHVFIGQLELDDPSLQLRPGMQGHARIKAKQHAIGWNLFHKPWNQLMLWLGW